MAQNGSAGSIAEMPYGVLSVFVGETANRLQSSSCQRLDL